MADAFVSYSRRDSDYVLGLADELRARGKDVWLDTEGLVDGEVFPQALRSAIELADGFVLVISPDSAASRYCAEEVEHATKLGKRIVPVLLHPVSDDVLPAEVRDRNWIPADAEDAGERVVRALETDLDHVRAHTRWTARAVEWEQSGRDRSLLPRGGDLTAGEAWLAGCAAGVDPAPTALQRELFLTARRAQSRRQRRLLSAAAGALVISLALLVFALIARHTAVTARHTADAQRTSAEAQALAARSQAALSLSPLAALHLARSAVQVQADDTTLRALKAADDAQTLIAAPPAVRYHDGCELPWPAYRPGRSELAIGSCDGTVRVLNARTGKTMRTWRFPGDDGTIAYRPDGDELAVLDRTRLLLVNPVSGAIHETLRVPAGPRSSLLATRIVYSPNGQQLALIDGTRIVIISERTHRVRTLIRDRNGFGDLAFTRNSQQLVVSISENYVSGYIGVFAVRSGREVRRLRLPPNQTAGPITASRSENQIAVGVDDDGTSGYIQLWNTHSWRLEAVRDRTEDLIDTLEYSLDEANLVEGTNENAVNVVPVSGGRASFTARMSNAVLGIAVGPAGKVAAIDLSGEVRVWRTLGAARQIIAPRLPGLQDVSQSGNTLRIASARRNGSGTVVTFYGANSRRSARPWLLARDGTRGDDFTENGRLLFDYQAGVNSKPTVWNVRTRQVVRRLPPLDIGTGLSFGRRLLLGESVSQTGEFADYRSVQTYNLETGRMGTRMNAELEHGCPGVGMALSSVGTRALVADDCRDLGVYNATSGRLLRQVKLPETLQPDGEGVALSPDGRLTAVFYPNGQGEILTTRTLTPQASLIGHVGTAGIVGFANNDRWLVTVGADHTMRVWRTADGSQIRTLQTPEALIGGTLLPDNRVAVVSTTQRVYVYDVCQGCGNASTLLRLSASEMHLPLTAIDRAIIQGR